MTLALIITALVTVLAAATVMSLRNLVHCALAMAVAFSGVAALYLQLNAEFVGFAEILVYVGAIAILIVFAILLTRSGETPGKSVLTSGWLAGVAVSAMVFTLLGWAVLTSSALPNFHRARRAGQKHRRRADVKICSAAGNRRLSAHRRDDRRGHHRFERR